MTNTNNNANNNLYLRVAVILLALNFALNGYFVYSIMKIGEVNQAAHYTPLTGKPFTKK
jgi:hypothetical protein